MSKKNKTAFAMIVTLPIIILGVLLGAIYHAFMIGWCYIDSIYNPEYYEKLQKEISK